jgi:hypothetical protein
MEQSLPLPWAARPVAGPAILSNLRDMSADSAPSSDLPLVILAAPASIVPAIPLEPAARVFMINPALLAPNRERLRRIHAEEIKRRFVSLPTKIRFLEPARGKLLGAIRHVLSPEDAELEHLFGRELGFERGGEGSTHWFRAIIDVAFLHQVVHFHAHRPHRIEKHRARGRACAMRILCFFISSKKVSNEGLEPRKNGQILPFCVRIRANVKKVRIPRLRGLDPGEITF